MLRCCVFLTVFFALGFVSTSASAWGGGGGPAPEDYIPKMLPGRSPEDILLAMKKVKEWQDIGIQQLMVYRVTKNLCGQIDCRPFEEEQVQNLLPMIYHQKNLDRQTLINKGLLFISILGLGTSLSALALSIYNTFGVKKIKKRTGF